MDHFFSDVSTHHPGPGPGGCGMQDARSQPSPQALPDPAQQNQSEAGKEQKPSWGQGLCSALGRGTKATGAPRSHPPRLQRNREREGVVRRQGRVGRRSLTFGGDFPFFQVFGFPANKLWISWGFFILLKLPWPPACAGRSLCLHKIPLLSARSPSLCRNHYRFGSKSFLGGFLALNF